MLVLCPSKVPRSTQYVNNCFHRDREENEIFHCNMPPKPLAKIIYLKSFQIFTFCLIELWAPPGTI